MMDFKISGLSHTLTRGADAAHLLLRLYIGGFLVWGVWDNITSKARMAEFQGFLASLNCPVPEIAAPVSVWAQFAVGLLLIAGLWTRPAGLLLSLNFLVAVWLMATGLEAPGEAVARELFGPIMCVLAGLILATHGGGRFSADAVLAARMAKA